MLLSGMARRRLRAGTAASPRIATTTSAVTTGNRVVTLTQTLANPARGGFGSRTPPPPP